MKKKIVMTCMILAAVGVIFALGGLFKGNAPENSTKAGDSRDALDTSEESSAMENSRGSEASASTADKSTEENPGYSENPSAETEPGTSASESAAAESTGESPAESTAEESGSAEEGSSEENSESGSEEVPSEWASEETPSGSEESTAAETGPTMPVRPTEPPTRPAESTEAKTEPTQPSTAHTHTTAERVKKAATCKETGTKEIYCTECGEVISSVTVAKLSHTTAERVKKAATCKETGTKEIYCTECREVLSTVTIQKLAHTTAERTRQAATCTAAGVKEIYCTKCGDVISTASIPKLSHTTERHVVREATTTAEGLYQMVCTICHTVVSEGSIPMIETEPAPTFYVHVEPPVDQHSVQCGYGSLAGAEYSLYRVNIGAGQTPSKTSPMTLIETFVSGADGTANSRSVETERDVWYCYRNSKASPGFVMYGTGGLSGKYFFFRNKSGVVNYTSDLQSYYKFEEDPTPGLLEFFWSYAAEKGFRTDIRSDSYDNPITVGAKHLEYGYEDIKSRIDTYAELYLPKGQITGLYAEVTGHQLAGEDGHSDEAYEITIYYSNVK